MESISQTLVSSTPKAKKETRETGKLIPKQLTLDGTLFIKKESPKSSYGENIRIGICIKAPSLPKSDQDWEQILEKTKIIKDNKRGFTQTERTWFNGGISWVIATPTFGITNLKIVLKPSALATTGFTIETYYRKFTATHVIDPNASFGTGLTIEFNVSWDLSVDNQDQKPTIKTSSWESYLAKKYSATEKRNQKRDFNQGAPENAPSTSQGKFQLQTYVNQH